MAELEECSGKLTDYELSALISIVSRTVEVSRGTNGMAGFVAFLEQLLTILLDECGRRGKVPTDLPHAEDIVRSALSAVAWEEDPNKA